MESLHTTATCGVKGYGGHDSSRIRCPGKTNPQRQKENKWWLDQGREMNGDDYKWA